MGEGLSPSVPGLRTLIASVTVEWEIWNTSWRNLQTLVLTGYPVNLLEFKVLGRAGKRNLLRDMRPRPFESTYVRENLGTSRHPQYRCVSRLRFGDAN